MPRNPEMSVPAIARRLKGLDGVSQQLQDLAKLSGRTVLQSDSKPALTQVGWKQYLRSPAAAASRDPAEARTHMEQIIKDIQTPDITGRALSVGGVHVTKGGGGGNNQRAVVVRLQDIYDPSTEEYLLHNDRAAVRRRLHLPPEDQPSPPPGAEPPERIARLLLIAGTAGMPGLDRAVARIEQEIADGQIAIHVGELAVITTYAHA